MHSKKSAQSFTVSKKKSITSFYIVDHTSHYAHLGTHMHTNFYKGTQHRAAE